MNDAIRQVVSETISRLDEELREMSLKIHSDPELGDVEYHASQLLISYLDKQGFKVTQELGGLKTAFMAEYGNSETGRRVGFCSEYDALPGVGHACGHNIIAIQGLACAIILKTLMEHQLVHGKVVLFGTPAEETTSGKITLVEKHIVQDNVDYAMMLHPFAKDSLYSAMLALDSAKIEFFGKAAHAGMAPWRGINALDAMMQGFNNVAMLRQQTLTTNRMHGIITHGGDAANVIPAYAAAEFYIRSLTRDQLRALKPKFENCFRAAALASGCTVEFSWGKTVEDVFANDRMTSVFKQHMEQKGIKYRARTDEEKETTGSTDMGNFSYVVPAIHPGYSIHTDAANHTKEFAEAARTCVAHQDTLRAAECLSLTAAEIMMDDGIYQDVLADFKKGKPQ